MRLQIWNTKMMQEAGSIQILLPTGVETGLSWLETEII